MALSLYHASVMTPGSLVESGALVVSDKGKVAYVGERQGAPAGVRERHDLEDHLIAPGFIDVHVHGGGGISFTETEEVEEALESYSRWVVRSGVTGFLCTLAAPTPENLVERVVRFASAMGRDYSGAQPLGLHLEGPFLNPEQRGAFQPEWLRPPDAKEARALVEAGEDWIRQVTMAPELSEAEEVAEIFHEAGVVVALGHSDADFQTAKAALQGRFSHVTHVFNAQSGFHHREPGVVGAVLDSKDATVEVIADGVHVHPAAIRSLVRSLGEDRVVLVTDAMAAAGMPDGLYPLEGSEVNVREGVPRLADGRLAGSAGSIDACVRNMVRMGAVSLVDAVGMATRNPARAMGFMESCGEIVVGKPANFVLLDEEGGVVRTYVRGRRVS